jgi:hypothetical protein
MLFVPLASVLYVVVPVDYVNNKKKLGIQNHCESISKAFRSFSVSSYPDLLVFLNLKTRVCVRTESGCINSCRYPIQTKDPIIADKEFAITLRGKGGINLEVQRAASSDLKHFLNSEVTEVMEAGYRVIGKLQRLRKR